MKKNKLDVYSPLQGQIKYCLRDLRSDYGRRVYIEYDQCIMMFAHLEEIYVKEGDHVEPGQVIGKMGKTGYSPSIHLHVSQFNKRAPKLTAKYAQDPTFTLKLAEYYVTNTKVSNGFGSKYCNPKLKMHEGIDFSGTKTILNWEDKKIDPLYQDYRLKKDYPEDYA